MHVSLLVVRGSAQSTLFDVTSAAANLSLPFSNWTSLGAVTEVSPGQFQFADLQAANLARRFYRVTSP
jgi:hypothetical protein